MIKPVLATIKISAQIIFLSSFAGISLMGRALIRSQSKRRHFHTRTVSFFSKLIFKTMGGRIQVKGIPPKDQHYLLVSNHHGFIEILALAALKPSLFITSLDIRATPGIGQLTELSGCLYVNRYDRSGIKNEVIKVRQALQDGHNVILFPEAGAFNGERIMPFKKTLMSAVAGTGVPILPVVVNFRRVNGEAMSHKWRDHVFWYGNLSFFTCGYNAHKLFHFDVEIEFLNPIHCETEDERKEVAALAQSQIETKFTQIPAPR